MIATPQISYTVNSDPLAAPFVCGFDGSIHESLDALHAHLKRFRLARAKYYQTYYPKKDPINGDPIPFKSLEQYLEQSFANRNTLKKWLKEHPVEGLTWSKDWLARRRVAKQLKYAPSQVELRSLCTPTMPYYDKVAASEEGYQGITLSLGYTPRYTLTAPHFVSLPQEAIIICDSREQLPLKLTQTTRIEALNVGDYALAVPHDIGIRIERKSLTDWCGTMSDRKVKRKGGGAEDCALQRFERELMRAQDAGQYVVMMVESSITDALSLEYLPQTKWVKATAAHLFKNLRDLLTKYPLTFQCVFVEGRTEMVRAMVKVFEMGEQVKCCDIQDLYERGGL